MNQFLSLIAGRLGRPKKKHGGAHGASPFSAEKQTDLPDFPEPENEPEGEIVPEPTSARSSLHTDAAEEAKGPMEERETEKETGPIRRITESIRNLIVRAEETVREAVDEDPGTREKTETIPSETSPSRTVPVPGPEEEERKFEGRETEEIGTAMRTDIRSYAAGSEQELDSKKATFFTGIGEEEIPYRRGGFAGDPTGSGEPDLRESFRQLLARAEEAKEILGRLNETADEIRRELTT